VFDEHHLYQPIQLEPRKGIHIPAIALEQPGFFAERRKISAVSGLSQVWNSKLAGHCQSLSAKAICRYHEGS
jgi:hypothetical protein